MAINHFSSVQKSQIRNGLQKYPFLSGSKSECYNLTDSLTVENCTYFVSMMYLALFNEVIKQKEFYKKIEELRKKYPRHIGNYDFLLCNLFNLTNFNYGTAINGYMFVVMSFHKLDGLYKNYQKEIEKYQLEEKEKQEKELLIQQQKEKEKNRKNENK